MIEYSERKSLHERTKLGKETLNSIIKHITIKTNNLCSADQIDVIFNVMINLVIHYFQCNFDVDEFKNCIDHFCSRLKIQSDEIFSSYY